MEICERHPEGVHLLGYSQGGLLARAILETHADHNVKKFISLSSPQAGQFGSKCRDYFISQSDSALKFTFYFSISAAFLHLIFPDLASKTAYNLFYSYVGQHTSVGNYWNDPHQQHLYYNFSSFLPYINNELRTSNSSSFRKNLLKLDEMILIGGPNDGVITPWESRLV